MRTQKEQGKQNLLCSVTIRNLKNQCPKLGRNIRTDLNIFLLWNKEERKTEKKKTKKSKMENRKWKNKLMRNKF